MRSRNSLMHFSRHSRILQGIPSKQFKALTSALHWTSTPSCMLRLLVGVDLLTGSSAGYCLLTKLCWGWTFDTNGLPRKKSNRLLRLHLKKAMSESISVTLRLPYSPAALRKEKKNLARIVYQHICCSKYNVQCIAGRNSFAN